MFQLISNSIARVTINSFSGTIVNGVGLVIGSQAYHSKLCLEHSQSNVEALKVHTKTVANQQPVDSMTSLIEKGVKKAIL